MTDKQMLEDFESWARDNGFLLNAAPLRGYVSAETRAAWRAYQAAYEDGFNEGHREGYQDGYKEGCEEVSHES